jgi:hypothetical protein
LVLFLLTEQPNNLNKTLGEFWEKKIQTPKQNFRGKIKKNCERGRGGFGQSDFGRKQNDVLSSLQAH